MHEEIKQELDRLRESGRHGGVLSADTFERPISELCKRPVQALDVSATIGDAVRTMQEGRFGAVPITRNGKLAGIVTERDMLMKVLGRPDEYDKQPVTHIMTPDPDALRAEDDLAYMMNRMHIGGFRHVPVVNDQGEPTHMVSLRDVLAFILDHFADVVQNIPSEPYRGEPTREGA